jgi:hypothetical protein
MVDQTIASGNHVAGWLRQLDRVRALPDSMGGTLPIRRSLR